jgi:hypothetical protein
MYILYITPTGIALDYKQFNSYHSIVIYKKISPPVIYKPLNTKVLNLSYTGYKTYKLYNSRELKMYFNKYIKQLKSISKDMNELQQEFKRIKKNKQRRDRRK